MNRHILLISLLTIALHAPSQACTVFSAAQGDIILAAANKDWDNINTRILFLPASEGKYGRVYFGYQIPEGFQNSGGMNDQGLWYDGASLPERSDIRNHYNKPTVKGELCEKALEECATVEEVIEMYTKYYSPHWQGHSMWADKYGNSVIIEYGEKDVVFVRKNSAHQVMTNFYVSDSANFRWYNCYRFKTANNMLKNSNEISLNLFRSTLDAVHATGLMPTVYSNIYDLKNGEIYVYNFHNYDEAVKLNLQKEFAKGEQYLKLPQLFSGIKLQTPCSGETVDGSSVNFKWNGEANNYLLYYSTDPTFAGCEPVEVGNSQLPKQVNANFFSIFLCLLFPGGFLLRKKKAFAIVMILIIGCFIFSCEIPTITSPYSPSKIEHSYTIENLQPNSFYFWKIEAIGENGINSESTIQFFGTNK